MGTPKLQAMLLISSLHQQQNCATQKDEGLCRARARGSNPLLSDLAFQFRGQLWRKWDNEKYV